jgi:hypothetical protein
MQSLGVLEKQSRKRHDWRLVLVSSPFGLPLRVDQPSVPLHEIYEDEEEDDD